MAKVMKKAKVTRFFNKNPAATVKEAAVATKVSYGTAWAVRKDIQAIADEVIGLPSRKDFYKRLHKDDKVFEARDEFTVTMNKDQFTFLMDKLWHDQSDMNDIVHMTDEDPLFNDYTSRVLLQGWVEVRSLYNDFKLQTLTNWDFNVGTQKLYMSDEGEL